MGMCVVGGRSAAGLGEGRPGTAHAPRLRPLRQQRVAAQGRVDDLRGGDLVPPSPPLLLPPPLPSPSPFPCHAEGEMGLRYLQPYLDQLEAEKWERTLANIGGKPSWYPPFPHSPFPSTDREGNEKSTSHRGQRRVQMIGVT